MNNYRTSNHSQTKDIGPEQIAAMLTLASAQLDEDITAKLRRARQAALERQAVPAPALAAVGPGWYAHLPHTPRQWAATALMVFSLAVGIAYWQNLREHEMKTHIDLSILTDDMPMDVFVDY